MSGIKFTTPSTTFGDNKFNGGLNTTAGSLELQDNESPDLQNIDFDKFGSITKRNGFTQLNSSATSGTVNSDGLHWFEFDSSGTLTRKLVCVTNGKFLKMDDLDGTWDDATNGVTITADNHCDFENWLNNVYITNNSDVPLVWDGAGTSSLATMTVPTGLTDARLMKQFNNYMFLANVQVSGTRHGSRIYWSNIKTTDTWTASDFIDIAKDDGQEITGMRVLADRLVIYKTRSIYNVFFTGDADIPFILPGGGKSNSSVGCVAPFSVQEVENGHVFLSADGLYFYDGNNSFKISDKITTTLLSYVDTRFDLSTSINYRSKNRYMISFTSNGGTTNDRVIVWDYFNNAFSLYVGVNASSMAIAYVSGTEERPYFADYAGFIYRGDTGTSDNPSGTATKITSYYFTNWRHFGDLMNQKGVPHVQIYHQSADSVLTFGYSYDFSEATAPNAGGIPATDFSRTINLTGGTSTYGSAVYGTGTYASEGGAVKRVDLNGRGKVVRFLFGNNVLDETITIDGLGELVHLETSAG